MASPQTIPVAASGRSALDVAQRCAQEAGEVACAAFRRPKEVSIKGRGNLVTQTDLEIEAMLHQALASEFPDHGVLSEETATNTSRAGWVWVVDPLDGTHNFVSGIPFFCVNIALCLDGEPVVAVTHDPLHDETFWAERDGGAWLNDRRIHASEAPSLEAAVLGIDLGYDDERASMALAIAYRLFPGVQKVRIPGSAALGLAYAACGRYDVFVHHYLFPWDIAPGILLVQEAGGVLTETDGRDVTLDSETVLAGGVEVHADMRRWLADHAAELGARGEA
jgi:fructose-1,6-bisphosphatase/inositol monophosphatase family enzyme